MADRLPHAISSVNVVGCGRCCEREGQTGARSEAVGPVNEVLEAYYFILRASPTAHPLRVPLSYFSAVPCFGHPFSRSSHHSTSDPSTPSCRFPPSDESTYTHHLHDSIVPSRRFGSPQVCNVQLSSRYQLIGMHHVSITQLASTLHMLSSFNRLCICMY